MEKRAMLVANSASMIDHFNRDNISILTDMGYKITVAANFSDGNSSSSEKVKAFYQELTENGIDIIDLPIPRKATDIASVFKSISVLKRYLAANPCALIHTQTPFGGVAGRIAAKRARKNGAKVIYFAHGFHFFKGCSLKSKIIFYNIEKYLTRYTDCLITLNHEDYELASRKFTRTKVKYVPGIGVDTAAIKNLSVDRISKCKALGLPADRHIILNVSELIPRKNLPDCLAAFKVLNRSDCILVICGKGAEQKKLSLLCEELGISSQVYFLGYRTDILEIYKISDLFLFTSNQEGLPVSVMQAMAAELPVVASSIRGNVDLLSFGESKECLIHPNNIDGYADAVNKILNNDSLKRRLGELNYNSCIENFDIKAVHEKMEQIYKNILND